MRVFWIALLGVFGLHGGSAFAAISGVLCSTDIQGESEVPAATGCVDVLAWSWGLSNPGGSGGGGAGVSSFQDISMTKYIDTSSEDLFRFVATGATLKGIVEYREYLECGSGCTPSEPYLTIHLNGTTVSALSTGGSGGESRHTENITLGYQQISYCYRPTVKGALGTAQCYAYDVTTHLGISPF